MRTSSPLRFGKCSAPWVLVSLALVLNWSQVAEGQLLQHIVDGHYKRPRATCRLCQSLGKQGDRAGTRQPKALPQVDPDPQPLADLAELPRGFGVVPGAFSAAPSMIGDFFGNGLGIRPSFVLANRSPTRLFDDKGTDPENTTDDNTTSDNTTGATGAFRPGATIAVAGGDRRFKLSDNSSPLPRDRVFFNYHHFHNALTDANLTSQNLDRYTFGLERTFLDHLASIELRVPFSGGLANQQAVSSLDTTGTEFGNLSLTLKGLLLSDDSSAVSAGFAMVFPTGADATVTFAATDSLEFRNNSFYLQPFLAYYRQINERLFHQFFVQFDFDTSGSDVRYYGAGSTDFTSEEIRSQNLMYLDYQLGWWWYRSDADEGIQGIAPIVELHYTTTLEDLENGTLGRAIFVQNARRDILNLTGGIYFQLSDTASLKVASAVPLRSELDKLFDAEFSVQYERRY
ncbi:MAG: hypothetical protein VX346_14165 [Planctomycetota bacterium]|nr:hypothetical protein [Planctomycetota bacterium]